MTTQIYYAKKCWIAYKVLWHVVPTRIHEPVNAETQPAIKRPLTP